MKGINADYRKLRQDKKKTRGSLLTKFFSFVLLEPHLGHVEVPKLGVQLELQPPAYTPATATQDPSCIFDPHHSSQQRRVPNPLSKARDRTRVLMDARSDSFLLSHDRNS